MLSVMCAVIWSWYISHTTRTRFQQALYTVALSVPFTILFVQLAKTVVWHKGKETIRVRTTVVIVMGLMILGLGTYGLVEGVHEEGKEHSQ